MKKIFLVAIYSLVFSIVINTIGFVKAQTSVEPDVTMGWGRQNMPVVYVNSESTEIDGKRIHVMLMEKDGNNRTLKSYNYDGLAADRQGRATMGGVLIESFNHAFPPVSTTTVKVFVAVGIPELDHWTAEKESDVPLPDLAFTSIYFSDQVLWYSITNINYNKREFHYNANKGTVGEKVQWLDANKNPIGPAHQNFLGGWNDDFPISRELRRDGHDNWYSLSRYIWQNIPAQAKYLQLSIVRGEDPNIESDTSNNEVALNRPIPDLILDNVSLTNTNLTYRVRNYIKDERINPNVFASVRTNLQWLDASRNPVGYARSLNSFQVLPNRESTQTFSNSSSSDLSMEYARRYIWENIPAEARFLRVSVIDYFKEADMDDRNNKADLALPYPDLVVGSVDFDEQYGYAIPTVKNQGTLDAEASFKVEIRWYKGKAPVGNPIELVLDEGLRAGRAYVAIPRAQRRNPPPTEWLPPAGATAVVVRVDVDHAIEELDETNNESSFNRPLQYPIPELGNCKSKEDCKKYCDRSENASACAEFGVSRGLLTEEEAQALRDMADIEDGPGGCTTKEGCAEFCEVPANIEACLNYAEQHSWMTADELSKARKVAGVLQAGGTTPGSCNTPTTCKTYCSNNSHAVECVAFGKTAGLFTAEEAAEAEKIAPLMQSGATPGGKTTKEELESYCESHRDECDQFFEQAGVKKGTPPEGEKPQENAPSIFEEKEGGGPGGCKTKAECDAYCDSHPGECDEAVIEAGGEIKEATAPCSTNEECKIFCQDPANAKACENIVIEEPPAESAKPEVINAEIEKLRQNILEMPPQSQDCVKQAWGAESFDKVMAGQAPETPVKAETLQSCYAEGVQKAGEEAAKKPEGQEERDAAVENSGGNLLQSVLNIFSKWFRK